MQRSFRLSPRTLELLDAAARATGASRNSLVEQLLGEAVRTARHPLIRFHTGAAGRRRPLLVGTRLYVHQVVATVRDGGGDVDEAASYLDLRADQVRAAVAYYADFADEVDEDAAVAQQIERDERDRWERQRVALGAPAGPAHGA